MVHDPIADVQIPRSAWSTWKPDVGPRLLRRALTPTERGALERRRDDLVPVLEPYGGHEVDTVALALLDMFGGYPSMRQTEEGAVARVDAVRRVLQPFPAWAIQKACAEIQVRGVWRNGRFDQQWPPSDAELAAATREAMRLYADAHESAIALLAAGVEET